MGALTQYTRKKILDHVLKTASYSPPATIYVGLSTADPTDAGSGWADPTYTGYARQSIAFGAAASRSIAQNALVTFAPCTAGSSTAAYYGLWDALSGGNLLAYGSLSVSKVITVGNTPSIASGQVTVSWNAAGIFTAYGTSVLGWLFQAQTLAQPTNVQLALSTTIPTDAGPNITEPSGNNYARVTMNTWSAATLASPDATSNSADAVFGAPSGSWGTVVYGVAYADTLPVAYLDIADQAIGIGDTAKFLATAFGITAA